MSSAIGYTRLSQDSDTSIDRQKRHIREYADQNGLVLEHIYDDSERSSGFDESRQEYQQVRHGVQSGKVAAVIVNDKRRLARDFDETMGLVLDLREHDVEAHTFQEGRLDLSDPVQAAVEVLQAASEHEAKKKEIKRAREAVQERIDNGHDHGRLPIGFRFDDAGEQWVPDREGRFPDVVAAIQIFLDDTSHRGQLQWVHSSSGQDRQARTGKVGKELPRSSLYTPLVSNELIGNPPSILRRSRVSPLPSARTTIVNQHRRAGRLICWLRLSLGRAV